MPYKESKENFIKEGLIKSCPLDLKAIVRLLKRARLDLKTAKRNLEADQECAFTYAYNGMLRSGLALMFAEGFRPETKNKHLTIVRFAGVLLGEPFKKLIHSYDFMRRKRHQFIYEPDAPCTMKEAVDAIKTAEEFVVAIEKIVKEKLPQKEFDFKNGKQKSA